MTASRISAARSTVGRFLPRRGVDLELVVGDEEERHLVGDLHERRRPLLGQLDRGFEPRDLAAGRRTACAANGNTADSEVGDRQRPDVLAVHPLELLRIERGGRRVHPIELELGDDLVERQDLASVFRPPAEQREVVEQRGRQISGVAVLLHRHRAVPLRQLPAARTEDQRHVRVHGLIVVTERAPQREHTVRRVDEILTPQHVRDVHVEIVDRVREEEHRRAVRPHDHEVGDRRPLDRDLAPDHVDERAATLVGGTKANRNRPSLGDARALAPRA